MSLATESCDFIFAISRALDEISKQGGYFVTNDEREIEWLKRQGFKVASRRGGWYTFERRNNAS